MYYLANDPGVPETVRAGDGPLGPAEGRVHRQRPLAAPDLRPRGAADGRRLRDDRAPPPRRSTRPPSRSAWARTTWTRTTSSATSTPRATPATRATSRSAPAAPTRSATGRSSRRPASARTCSCRSACRRRHVAYGSIRMEPVFIILGQSAATAAALAIDDQGERAGRRLFPAQAPPAGRQAGARPAPRAGDARASPATSLPGVVVDDDQAELTGDWAAASAIGPFVGAGLPPRRRRRQGEEVGRSSARRSSRAGTRSASPTRRTRTARPRSPCSIRHAGGDRPRDPQPADARADRRPRSPRSARSRSTARRPSR